MKSPTNQQSQHDWPDLYARHLAEWEKHLSAALAAAEFDSVVIFAGAEKTLFRDDLTYPYAVEPYFKLWLPLIDRPGSALRLTPGEKPLLIELREPGFWHETPQEPSGHWVQHFEIRQAASPAAIAEELGRINSRVAAIGEPVAQTEIFESVNAPTLLNHLDYHRAYKTSYEIACIERAAGIASLGHRAAKREFGDDVSEYELHNAYCVASGQTGADLPYPNIVALNEHASILHYQNLHREAPRQTRSFLLDAGAQFNGYASDITRTYARGEPLFEALIDSMDAMQQTLYAEARAGTDFGNLHDMAHRLLAGVLKNNALVSCSEEQAYDDGITRMFLPHGLGHLLGLQVHDVGGWLSSPSGELRKPPEKYPMLRLTRQLEPGIVVTIEPGIYFIPSLLNELEQSTLGHSVSWDKITALLSCGGIRVEDDILVTAAAPRNLSRQALLDAAES